MNAVFAFVHGTLLRSLSQREPDRLVALFEYLPQFADLLDWPALPVNAMHCVEWSENASSFSDMKLFGSWEVTPSDTSAGRPAWFGVAQVWPAFLSTLGDFPQIGRGFLDEGSEPGKGRCGLTSSGLSRERFGSSASVVESGIVSDDRVCDTVRILPDGFRLRG